MAIHAKRVHPQSSVSITADGNIAATDLQYEYYDPNDPTTLVSTWQGTVRKIERVVNHTGANITVNGTTFGPGTWDLTISGGIDLGANLTAVTISGGLVTLRGDGGTYL